VRRRQFIPLAAAAIVWPASAIAQTARKPTIGFLGSGTSSSQRHVAAAFVQRLRELGWTEGSNVLIDYRWAEGRAERYAEIAAEFAKLNVDVVLASGAASVAAAKQVSSVTPIVFPVVNDPLGTGLIASLARPGGNVTGLSLQNSDLAGKRLDILREAVPGLRRLAVLASSDPGAIGEFRELRAMLEKVGVQPVLLEITNAADIASVVGTLKDQPDALYVCSDAITIANRAQIADLALRGRLPTMNGPREFADAGGLMAYGANIPDLFRRSADFVDKVLRGAKAGEIPVEQPTKFDLVVNLKTAKTLGLTVSPTLLARADEVIE
jgi:putative ABC transport system substrate-binding protein